MGRGEGGGGKAHRCADSAPLRLVGLDVNIGDAMMLLAALFYALHSLMLRYKPKIGWLSFIACTSFFAMLAAFAYQSLFGTGPAGLVAAGSAEAAEMAVSCAALSAS